MKPSQHAAAGLAGGAAALLLTGSAEAALAFALSTVLMDLDHVVDYLLFGAPPRTLRRFLAPGDAGVWGRVVFVLHSYELLLVLALFWMEFDPPQWGGAVLAGMAAHLLMDEWGNRRKGFHLRLPVLYYSFLYRLSRGFRGEALLIAK
ncbi:MAG: hypothetical protein AB1916_16150 [Thermodesulfobacteriota bacterium]